MAEALTKNGVDVDYLGAEVQTPNLHFVQDLFAMTPLGAVVARPASEIRAGEEVAVARALAAMRVPIITTICGSGTFEGADLAYLSANAALVAVGWRTNGEGRRQVEHALRISGIRPIRVSLPRTRRHLDEAVSIVDDDLALVSHDVSEDIKQALHRAGFELLQLPVESDSIHSRAINLIVVHRGLVVLPAGNPRLVEALSTRGIAAIEIAIPEISKTGGGVHCLIGVLQRSDD